MQSSAPTGSWPHSHTFDKGNSLAERNTRWAVALTSLMMVAEIIGGWAFNSMALLADGWHMSSHALALGLSVLAYRSAQHFANDKRFSFGTWKIEVLGGYTSALFLVGIAGLMFYQSLERLLAPTSIHYGQAIAIATVGLLVNMVCAWLLKGEHKTHNHHHDHYHHNHDGHDHSHDLNLRSAYLHVLADAATSILAIFALIGGRFLGANWLDPIMGIVGSGIVSVWAYGLLRDAGRVLLDAEMDAPLVAEIREVIATSPITCTITDLHVWRVGKGKYACILSLATENKIEPVFFKQLLSIHDELVHITVEVNSYTLNTPTNGSL